MVEIYVYNLYECHAKTMKNKEVHKIIKSTFTLEYRESSKYLTINGIKQHANLKAYDKYKHSD